MRGRVGLAFALAACVDETAPLRRLQQGGVAAAFRFGDEAPDRPLALAASQDGDAVVAGIFSGSLDFGVGARLGPSDQPSLFAARISPEGRARWAREMPPLGAALAQIRLAVSPEGAPILFGTLFGGDLDLGTGPLTAQGSSDLLVAVLDPARGRITSAARLGGPGAQVAGGLGASDDGSIYLAGRATALDLGPDVQGPVEPGGGDERTFVTRLDRALVPRALALLESPAGPVILTGFAVAPAKRELALAVRFTGALEVTGRRIASLGGPGAAVVRFDASLSPVAHVTLRDASGSVEVLGVALDRHGTLHAGGTFEGTLTLGEVSLPSGGLDGFWLRMGVDGRVEAGRVGGPGQDGVRDLAADPSGRTWLVGTFEQRLDEPYTGRALAARAFRAAYALRVDRDGRARRGLTIDAGRQNVFPAGIALGPAGAWWLGVFWGSVDAGGFRLTSAGDRDVLLLRFEPG